MILSTIRQYLAAFLGIIIVALAAYGAYQHIQHLKAEAKNVTLEANLKTEKANVQSVKKALDAREDELKVLQDTLSKHQQELGKLRQEQEATDAKLRQALRSNRAWADTPLPVGVRDALRKDR